MDAKRTAYMTVELKKDNELCLATRRCVRVVPDQVEDHLTRCSPIYHDIPASPRTVLLAEPSKRPDVVVDVRQLVLTENGWREGDQRTGLS